MKKIQSISVDDEELNLIIIEDLAGQLGLETKSFQDPLEAAEYVRDNAVDIAFIDYLMPGMNGIDFIEHIRRFHENIPIVMITAIGSDNELKLRALEAGATEFLTKPIEAPDFMARIKNLVSLRKSQLLLKDRALHLQREIELATSLIQDREYETLDILGKAAEYKDPETANHIFRVAHYSRLIAEEIGKDEETLDLIFHSSKLHDVGKFGISDAILLKPGRLTAGEFDVIKNHTIIGYEIMKNHESKYLQAGARIALTHHERYDGTGYPYGLEGNDIHPFGRIVAVADVFDALTSRRTYKEPWALDRALDYIEKQTGSHFCPAEAEAFLKRENDILLIHNEFMDYEDVSAILRIGKPSPKKGAMDENTR